MTFMNSKGQAALVDSLFFIAIVSTICTGLFYFAINYGANTEALMDSFYSSDFAMDALKVITYVNVMRDGSAVSTIPAGSGETRQYDYLLALLKEDYSQNVCKTEEPQKIGPDSRRAIANTLYSVLKPFDDSIDYVFYIVKEGTTAGDAKFVTLIIATHEEGETCSVNDPSCYCRPSPSEDGSIQCNLISRAFYSCNPTENNVLEKFIFPYVGKVDSANGKVTFSGDASSCSGSSSGINSSPFMIGLHTWVSKNVAIMSTPGENSVAQKPEFGPCTIIDGVNVS